MGRTKKGASAVMFVETVRLAAKTAVLPYFGYLFINRAECQQSRLPGIGKNYYIVDNNNVCESFGTICESLSLSWQT